MRRFSAIVVAVLIALTSANAFAQDGGGDGGQKSKFYDFDDMTVDGELKTPDVHRTEARGQAKFQRLLDLKKSFLPKVQQSTEEEALK
jgi:hypothetical protein